MPCENRQGHPPRVIWMLWLQGWDQAPSVAKASLASWTAQNPGWRIHALDRSGLARFLPANVLDPILSAPIPPEALSDRIRLELLHRYGGVWADATTLCARPLDDWLADAMPHGFFAFDRPGPDRMLASWFLAAEKGSLIIARWREAALRYWQGRTERSDYFWLHQLFAAMYGTDEGARSLWDATPKITAAHPLHFAPGDPRLQEPPTAAMRSALGPGRVSVVKLTHKCAARCSEGSTFAWLCGEALGAPRAVPEGRPVQTRVLVGWYGSFPGHGTIGDLRSVEAVVSHLVARGHGVTHATASPFDIHGAVRADWRAVPPDQFDAVLFVCGPILRHHPETGAFFERFRDATLAGLGVSLLPRNDPNHLNPFVRVFARQGMPEIFGDVAATACSEALVSGTRTRTGDETPVIGLALRGEQHEYGAENCLFERAHALFEALTDVLARHSAARVVNLENHLARAGVSPDEIERRYSRCDLVLTTRFHGAVLALRQGVPFVALDQIRGGAKVLPLLRELGWDAVRRAETTEPLEVIRMGLDLLDDPQVPALALACSRAVSEGNRTLCALDAWIDGLNSASVNREAAA